MVDGANTNVKPIMGEEELEAALRLVQRIRLTANDGNPMYTNLEAAVLVHEYTQALRKAEADRWLAYPR